VRAKREIVREGRDATPCLPGVKGGAVRVNLLHRILTVSAGIDGLGDLRVVTIGRWLAGASALAMLTGCGGGGGGGSTGSTPVAVVAAAPAVAPTPTPSPAATAAPTPTPSVAAFPAAPAEPSSWAAGAAALFDVAPDVPGCRTGTLKASVKADVLLRINAIRAVHRLPAVTYADVDDAQAADSSLMMAANSSLSHTPPTTWKCYTASGAAGAGSGNLYGGVTSPFLRWYSEDDYIGGWLTEIASPNIGHRRWILDPFLGKISYGRVSQVLSDGARTDAATLKVFSFTGGVTTPTGLPPFVAYPYGDYPARYMDGSAWLSFSVVGGASGRSASGGVRFGNAQVSVTGGGTTLSVTNVQSDNDGYGLPNVIQWKTAGLQPGVTYTVKISGVSGAPQAAYEYSFKLV